MPPRRFVKRLLIRAALPRMMFATRNAAVANRLDRQSHVAQQHVVRATRRARLLNTRAQVRHGAARLHMRLAFTRALAASLR